jgi:Carboxypeptidase regulatory-like domain
MTVALSARTGISRQRGFWLRCFLGCMLVALVCGVAHAQQLEKDGPIRLTHVEGVVVTGRGAPAANVEVTLSQDDKVRMSTHTDQSGKFRIDHVQGDYMFRVARTLNAPAAHAIVVRAEIATYIERKKLYIVLGPGACADECSLVVTSKEEFEHAIRKNGGR